MATNVNRAFNFGVRGRSYRFVTGVALAGLIATSCAPPPAAESETTVTDTETTVAESETTAPGAGTTAQAPASAPNELIFAIDVEPNDLSAGAGYAPNNGLIHRQIFDTLLTRDAETGELIGMLATDWEQVDDLNWQFTIRQGVEFHDGTPLNAETAAQAFNWVWDVDNNYILQSQAFRGQTMTATAVDEYVMQVESSIVDPVLPARMTLTLLMSPTAIQEMDREELDQTPIGTGAYKFVEWQRGSHVLLEANDNYWGEEAGFGSVNFDSVRILFRPEPASRIAAVQAGEAHYAHQLLPRDCVEAFADRCIIDPAIHTVVMRPDHPSPLLGDHRVREAIDLAIDADEIGTQLIGPDVEEAAFMVTSDVVQLDREPRGYDPDRAVELLAEARADGVPVDEQIWLVTAQRFVNAKEVVEAVTAQLAAVGLNVRFEQVDEGTFVGEQNRPYAEIPDDRHMLIFNSHANFLYDFLNSAPWFTCTGAITGYCDAALDDMLGQAASLPLGSSERDQAMTEVAEIVYDEIIMFSFFRVGAYSGHAEGLQWTPRNDHWVFARDMTWEG